MSDFVPASSFTLIGVALVGVAVCVAIYLLERYFS